ncbi:MAG TPA: alkaline phosphatase family protein [Stellaceae bacterium]|nr:alkaline phosphatase family protein [Stellaceae bacterium]
MRATTLKLSLATAALLAGVSAASAQADYKPAQGTPKHAVLIFIDGFRADLLDPEIAPHIAALGRAGTRFANAEVGFPSDSMPGILGPLTGASPKGTGIPYDEYYDRHYKLAIEITETVTVPPGLKPHDLLKVPTLFEAAKAKGLKTAFVSKHIGYEILQGPSGKGIDNLELPESTDWKGPFKDYDAKNFEMLASWVGKDGADIAGIYAIAPNYAMKDHGVAAAETRAAVSDIDAQVGRVVDAVTAAGRYDDTVFVVLGDHGDTDTPNAVASKGDGSVVAFLAEQGIKAAKITAADVMLAWLADSSQAEKAVSLLNTPEAKERFGVDRVLGPDELKKMQDFADDQMPDFVLLVKPGVVYTKLPSKKMAEHGGAFDSDLRVAFVIEGPGIKSGAVVKSKVNIFSTAPTLAKLLNLSLPSATSPVLTEALR